MAVAEPLLLSRIGTERLIIKAAGGRLTRLQKLERIAESSHFHNQLYVCTTKRVPARNCGYCFKCRRTLVALDLLGLDKTMKESFDEDYYRARRRLMMFGLLVSAAHNGLDDQVAPLIYERMGPWRHLVRPWIAIFALIKPRLPAALVWRIRTRWPYLW
jgi:hypothetical protein